MGFAAPPGAFEFQLIHPRLHPCSTRDFAADNRLRLARFLEQKLGIEGPACAAQWTPATELEAWA